MRMQLAVAALCVGAAIPAGAATIVVDAGGGGAFTTIQAAIDDAGTVAGDIIEIMGTGKSVGDAADYAEIVTVSKAVTLRGINNPIVEAPVVAGPYAGGRAFRNVGVVQIASDDVTVEGLLIKVNAPYAGWGVLAADAAGSNALIVPATGPFDNLVIDGCTIWPQIAIGPVPARTAGGSAAFDLYRVRGMRLDSNNGTVIEEVTVRNTTITYTDDGGNDLRTKLPGNVAKIPQIFGRGMSISDVKANIINCDVTGFVQDIHTDFLNAPLLVQGTTFRCAGLEMSGLNGAGDAFVTGNTFSPEFVLVDDNGDTVSGTDQYPFQNAILVKANNSSNGVFIEDNTFYTQARGVYSTAAQNVIVSGNTFAVSETTRNDNWVDGTFIHVDVDRAWPQTCCSGSIADSEIRVSGNDFQSTTMLVDGNPVSGIGVRFAFINSIGALGYNPTINDSDTSICGNNFDASLIAIMNDDATTDLSGEAVDPQPLPNIQASDNWYGGVPNVDGATVAGTVSTNETTQAVDFALDSDYDGLKDVFELCVSGTNPFDKDTDGDRIEDRIEVLFPGQGLDPLVPNVYTDNDNDGLPAAIDSNDNDPDSDGDGVADSTEVALGTDPDSAASKPGIGDVNDDGTIGFDDGLDILQVFLGLKARGDLVAPQNIDVNRDGAEDNVDGVIVINYFLGNIPAVPFPFKPPAPPVI
ncbi:MAG: hypothetical protein PWP23_931 [Candidatus Sumerlaeota bacterium]|nr:hypothetical protein [Candidatus Sumerlaeota bacterium]